MTPDLLVISWHGRQVQLHHDAPHPGPDTPRHSVIHSNDAQAMLDALLDARSTP